MDEPVLTPPMTGIFGADGGGLWDVEFSLEDSLHCQGCSLCQFPPCDLHDAELDAWGTGCGEGLRV